MVDKYKSEKIITTTGGKRTEVYKVNGAIAPIKEIKTPIPDASKLKKTTSGVIVAQSQDSSECCNEHLQDFDNPHNVTATQVGATTAQWNANKLQGFSISTTDPTTNQILSFDGSTWVPIDADFGGGEVNADDITSGTLGDGRLSSNVPLKDAVNAFTNTNSITSPAAGSVPLTVKGTTAQSVNLVEFKNVSNTTLSNINSEGDFVGNVHTSSILPAGESSTITIGNISSTISIPFGLSGNGSGLTALNATNVVLGTLADGRLSSNIPLKNGVNAFTNTNSITSPAAGSVPLTVKGTTAQSANILEVTNVSDAVVASVSPTGVITGNGSGLTTLNASNVSSGTLGDGRLSSNVPLKDGNPVFQTTVNANSSIVIKAKTGQDNTNKSFEVQAADGTPVLYTRGDSWTYASQFFCGSFFSNGPGSFAWWTGDLVILAAINNSASPTEDTFVCYNNASQKVFSVHNDFTRIRKNAGTADVDEIRISHDGSIAKFTNKNSNTPSSAKFGFYSSNGTDGYVTCGTLEATSQTIINSQLIQSISTLSMDLSNYAHDITEGPVLFIDSSEVSGLLTISPAVTIGQTYYIINRASLALDVFDGNDNSKFLSLTDGELAIIIYLGSSTWKTGVYN